MSAPSFTPIQNNRQNYGFVYINPCYETDTCACSENYWQRLSSVHTGLLEFSVCSNSITSTHQSCRPAVPAVHVATTDYLQAAWHYFHSRQICAPPVLSSTLRHMSDWRDKPIAVLGFPLNNNILLAFILRGYLPSCWLSVVGLHTSSLYLCSASNSAGPGFVSLFADQLTWDLAEYRKLLMHRTTHHHFLLNHRPRLVQQFVALQKLNVWSNNIM
jgi:hypothetical protein